MTIEKHILIICYLFVIFFLFCFVFVPHAGCNSSSSPPSWRIRAAGTWTSGGPCRRARPAPPGPSRASAWAPRRRARRPCRRCRSSRCRPRRSSCPATRPASVSPTRRRARYRNRWRCTGRSRDTARLTRRSPPAGDAPSADDAHGLICSFFGRFVIFSLSLSLSQSLIALRRRRRRQQQ